MKPKEPMKNLAGNELIVILLIPQISTKRNIPIATQRSATGIPTGRLAVWWVLASEIVIFGGLLGSYVMIRSLYGHWAESAAHTNLLAGSINTFVLLTSSLFMVLAHHAAEHNDTTKACTYLWRTVLGGLLFLVIVSIFLSIFGQLISGGSGISGT